MASYAVITVEHYYGIIVYTPLRSRLKSAVQNRKMLEYKMLKHDWVYISHDDGLNVIDSFAYGCRVYEAEFLPRLSQTV